MAGVLNITQERLIAAAVLFAAALVGAVAGAKPSLAIGMAIGAAFLITAFAALPVAIAIYCFEPLGVAIDESSAVVSAAILLGISWLASLASADREEEELGWKWSPLMGGAIALLVALALLSSSWAESPATAIETALLYLGAFPLALVVMSAIQTRRDALIVAGGLFVGACAAAAYAFLVPRENFAEAERLGSTSVDPNELASVLIVGIAFAGAIAVMGRRSPALRVVAIGGASLCLVAIGLTVSRGGLLALAVAFIAAVIFGGRWRGTIAVIGVVVGLCGYYYFTVFAPPEARERLEQANLGDARILDGRTTLWQVGWRIVEDKPVNGVGAGNFEISAKHYLLEPGNLPRSDQIIDTPKVVHNTFLQFLTELGVLGLSLFMFLVVCAFAAAARAARIFRVAGDVDFEALARATLVGLAGLLCASFFISQGLSKHLWFLIGFGPALLVIARRSGGGSESA